MSSESEKNRILSACQERLNEGVRIDDIHNTVSEYLSHPTTQAYAQFEKWPQHNQKDQMELMLKTAAEIASQHREPQHLITALLSQEIFRASGEIMIREAGEPTQPVWWVGHDIVAKEISQR